LLAIAIGQTLRREANEVLGLKGHRFIAFGDLVRSIQWRVERKAQKILKD
jgi:hypothetical protein